MVDLERTDDVTPVCPFCCSEVRKMLFHELRGFLGRRFVYFCSDCRAVLGVSHRKGFWMG